MSNSIQLYVFGYYSHMKEARKEKKKKETSYI